MRSKPASVRLLEAGLLWRSCNRADEHRNGNPASEFRGGVTEVTSVDVLATRTRHSRRFEFGRKSDRSSPGRSPQLEPGKKQD